MENLILYVVTIVITWLMGIFAKKSKYISTHLIPVQNLLIGIIVTLIYWAISKDFQAALLITGSLAGGLYDIAHNLQKLMENNEEIQDTFNEDDLESIDTEAEDVIGEKEEEEIEILANETDDEDGITPEEAIEEVIEATEEGEN